MQLTKVIQLPPDLTTAEKADFLQDVILYLHDRLEETESVPAQRSFSFIGTSSAVAVAWSVCGMGLVSPVIAIPGAIVIGACSLLTGVALAKDAIESPELLDLQKRLVTVLESKEIDQWVKLWEEVGTEGFLRRLSYSCMGSFTAKGTFRHKSGGHPFDAAALFGGGKSQAPWEKPKSAIAPPAPIRQPDPQLAPTVVEPPAPIDRQSNSQPTSTIELPTFQSSPEPTVSIPPRTLKLGKDWTHYREIGEAIIRSMAVTDKSVLIASGTGTGKSTTEKYLLTELLRRYPSIEFHAILNKNDALPGLNPKNALVFEPEWLDALDLAEGAEQRLEIVHQTLEPLFNVYDVYLQRKRLSESERKRIKESKPIRLILGDWFATYQELKSRLKKNELDRVLAMVRQIVTVGRDSGVGLVIDTQSCNLDSLGLANDASIRLSLDMFAQGFIYYEDGEEKGEVQTIRLMFSNPSVCASDDREEIAKAYQLLSTAIKKGELTTPIIFTTVGAKPRIGIVPHLEVPTDAAQPAPKPALVHPEFQQDKILLDAVHQAREEDSLSREWREIQTARIDDLIDALPKELKDIVCFATRKQTWITATDIKNSGIGNNAYRDCNPDLLRDRFQQLVKRGIGQVDREGDRLRYTVRQGSRTDDL